MICFASNAIPVMGVQGCTDLNAHYLNLHIDPSSLAIYEPRFSTSTSIKWDFPSWCHTERSFFATVTGEDLEGNSIISRLFYIEYDLLWTTYILHDVSTLAERSLALSGKDFISSSSINVLSTALIARTTLLV